MEPIVIGGVLYHHGILGQRWGRQNGPPYPLGEGDHSSAEKKQAKKSVSTLRGYLKDRKIKKKRNAALQKARQVRAENKQKAEEAKQHEAEKQKALSSGSAADVLKYQGELSNQELMNAINRLSYEKQLKDISQKDIVTTADKVDNVMKKIDKARDWAEKGIKAYNTVAKIVNAVNEDTVMPEIGKEYDKRKKQLEYAKQQAEIDQIKANTAKSKAEAENKRAATRLTDQTVKQKKYETKEAKRQYKENKRNSKGLNADSKNKTNDKPSGEAKNENSSSSTTTPSKPSWSERRAEKARTDQARMDDWNKKMSSFKNESDRSEKEDAWSRMSQRYEDKRNSSSSSSSSTSSDNQVVNALKNASKSYSSSDSSTYNKSFMDSVKEKARNKSYDDDVSSTRVKKMSEAAEKRYEQKVSEALNKWKKENKKYSDFTQTELDKIADIEKEIYNKYLK